MSVNEAKLAKETAEAWAETTLEKVAEIQRLIDGVARDVSVYADDSSFVPPIRLVVERLQRMTNDTTAVAIRISEIIAIRAVQVAEMTDLDDALRGSSPPGVTAHSTTAGTR